MAKPTDRGPRRSETHGLAAKIGWIDESWNNHGGRKVAHVAQLTGTESALRVATTQINASDDASGVADEVASLLV